MMLSNDGGRTPTLCLRHWLTPPPLSVKDGNYYKTTDPDDKQHWGSRKSQVATTQNP